MKSISITTLMIIASTLFGVDAEIANWGIITALAKGEFKEFHVNTDKAMKDAIPEHVFNDVSNKYESMLAEGHYAVHFMGTLKKGKHVVYLYKIQTDKSDDDILAQITLTESKITGFFIN